MAAAVDEPRQGVACQVDGALPAGKSRAFRYVGQNAFGNLLQFGLIELVKGNDAIDAIEKLGAKELLDGLAVDVACRLRGWCEANVAGSLPRAQVRGQDDHGAGKAGRPPQGVGQAGLAENLQEQIEDVRMGLLDFVQQQHAKRLAANGSLVSRPSG